MSALQKLGRDVATALKPGPGERGTRQRAALLAVDWERRRRAGWVRRAVPALAVLAFAAAIVLVGSNGRQVRPGHPGVTELPGDAALVEGRWLQVTGEALKLRFADRTELLLEHRSTARFSPAPAPEARLTLEAGSLRARIEPAARTGRSWSFHAGPFRVLVIGTELAVGWSAETNLLSVHVVHGRAQVRGGALEPDGVLLGSGDRLEVQDGKIVIQRGAPAEHGHATAIPAPAAPPHSAQRIEPARPAREEPVPAPSAKGASSAHPSASSWEDLARTGEYRQALASAEHEGFDTLIERLSAADLALLADAARLGGNNARARQALLTLRRRFPAVGAAQVGAFRLGRLALAERKYGEAATWFEVYLKAAPSGTLAAEAAGRLIEARSRAGNRSGAEAAARDYLRRFPGGSYESVARALLRGDKLAPR